MATGPITLSVVGDAFTNSCRVITIIWEGETASGDTAEIHCIGTGGLVWPGRADGTNTYLGATFAPTGIPCANGYRLTKLSAARVIVYPLED